MKAKVVAKQVGPLVMYCRAAGLPEPVCEYRFHPTRKWRFDYAFPAYRLAVEVEGGAWTGGRHTTGAGFVSDMEKYNAATLMGWRILRYLPKQLKMAPTDLMPLLRPTDLRTLQAVGIAVGLPDHA